MPRRRSSPVRRPAPEMRRAPPASPPSRPAASSVPAAAPAAQVAAPASQGPGLMGQMAATAGGVAIGSVVGHGLTSAIFGGGGSSSNGDAAQQAPTPLAPQSYGTPPPMQTYDAGYPHPPPQGGQSNNICGYELDQFLQCAQNSADITFCQGLSEALKQCKMSYGQYGGMTG